MGSRLKLVVAYDGASFSGWQSQVNRNTIQDHLESAFQRICSKPVRVHGAGRTDAGVHAFAQCAHVDLPTRRYEAARWTSALNGILPSTIRVVRCQFVFENFHARYSAKGKIYRYRIWNVAVPSPFERGRAWHDRGRHSHLQNGPGSETDLRADAGTEMGNCNGRVRVERRNVSLLCSVAGDRSIVASRCLHLGVPAPT